MSARCRSAQAGHLLGRRHKNKTPTRVLGGGLFCGCLTMSYFRMEYTTLSSAQRRFTALFGMGRGGTTSLCSSDVACNLSAVNCAAAAESYCFEEVKG